MANHSEDLACGRLLFERFSEVAITGLKLCKQPHILNGDDRLVGEGLQELDLRGREWSWFSAGNSDGTDRHSFPQHWYAEETASADRMEVLLIVLRIEFDIGHVGDAALEDSPADGESTA